MYTYICPYLLPYSTPSTTIPAVDLISSIIVRRMHQSKKAM